MEKSKPVLWEFVNHPAGLNPAALSTARVGSEFAFSSPVSRCDVILTSRWVVRTVVNLNHCRSRQIAPFPFPRLMFEDGSSQRRPTPPGHCPGSATRGRQRLRGAGAALPGPGWARGVTAGSRGCPRGVTAVPMGSLLFPWGHRCPNWATGMSSWGRRDVPTGSLMSPRGHWCPHGVTGVHMGSQGCPHGVTGLSQRCQCCTLAGSQWCPNRVTPVTPGLSQQGHCCPLGCPLGCPCGVTEVSQQGPSDVPEVSLLSRWCHYCPSSVTAVPWDSSPTVPVGSQRCHSCPPGVPAVSLLSRRSRSRFPFNLCG